jgi:hypothetical protein
MSQRRTLREGGHSFVDDEASDCLAGNHRELVGTAGTPPDKFQNDWMAISSSTSAPQVSMWPNAQGLADNSLVSTENPQSNSRAHTPMDKSNIFLNLTRQWLSQEAAPVEENLRAAIAMQSFIQGNLSNEQALKVALALCEDLHIDGAECMQWCKLSSVGNGHCRIGSFSLDLKYLKLPPFIDSLTSRDNAAAFVYSYHNGHETYATNDAW